MPIPLHASYDTASYDTATYDTARLRLAARESRDAGQPRRLLALAAICNGATRSEATSIGGVQASCVDAEQGPERPDSSTRAALDAAAMIPCPGMAIADPAVRWSATQLERA